MGPRRGVRRAACVTLFRLVCLCRRSTTVSLSIRTVACQVIKVIEEKRVVLQQAVSAVRGSEAPTVLRALRPLQSRSHVAFASEEHGQRRSRLPRQSTIWQRSWTGSKKTSTSRIRRSLRPCKRKWSRLGKLTSSPNAKPELPRLRSKQLSRPYKIARPRWPSRRPSLRAGRGSPESSRGSGGGQAEGGEIARGNRQAIERVR